MIKTMHAKYNLNRISCLMSFLFVIYNNSGWVTYGKNIGFFCDDESIRKPYHGDSVRVAYLLAASFLFFPLIIYVTENIFKPKNYVQTSKTSQFKLFLKYYYSGSLYILTATEVLKSFINKLRPHFYYTCLPDMSNIDCSKGLITDFSCKGNGPSWLIDRDIYKSFPSGHAALSTFTFIFVYMHLRSKKNTTTYNSCISVWWSRIIPVMCFMWALTCSVSRILDNRHFWLDVLSGISIGLVGGFAMIHFALSRSIRKSITANN